MTPLFEEAIFGKRTRLVFEIVGNLYVFIAEFLCVLSSHLHIGVSCDNTLEVLPSIFCMYFSAPSCNLCIIWGKAVCLWHILC
jgi:hypothetical protein